MRIGRAVGIVALLWVATPPVARAQYTSYVASPSGISKGATPSVLSVEIQTSYPRAIVRKNDGTTFVMSGTMTLYQDGIAIASAPQQQGTASSTINFVWNFKTGTHKFYAMSSTNPYASGSVSVTAGYIPAAPTGVTAAAISSSEIKISWNAVSGATRYKVRMPVTGAETGDITALTTTWGGLPANTNSCFEVRACAEVGFCSAASPLICMTTLPAAPVRYKVGVVLYGNDDDPSLTVTRANLNAIIKDIAKSRPVRSGNGREVRLTVQLEVPWDRTDATGFWWYQQFARLCEELKVKWTPLLSPHYVPPTVQQWYAADRVTNMAGTVVDPAFLKFSPSSPVWGAQTAKWVEAFVVAMQNDGGINHFGISGAIDEILVGNEMQYPTTFLTSRDAQSVTQWHAKYGSATPYPTTLTTTFRNFRADRLSYAMNAMVLKARQTLDGLGLSTIGVSSKLYPYNFPRADEQEEQRRAGYTSSSLSFLDSNFRGIFAIDSYPSSYCGGAWNVTNDYAAARTITSKPLTVGEFNVPKELPSCANVNLTRAQVKSAVLTGFQSYNVRAFTFFAWNPKQTIYGITPDQKLGLGDAMDWVVP